MKKLFIILISTLIFTACSLPFTKAQKSALDVKSDSVATVYLNGDHVGSTPFYKDDLKPGEYTVKLSLESDSNNSWQTQIILKPQLLTNITKFFGNSPEESQHFTLSLEEISDKENSKITVITLPDSAVIKIDSQPVGFSPVDKDNISPGEHNIIIGSPGYKQLNIPIKTIAGHKLTIFAQLAKDKDLSITQEESISTPSAQIQKDDTPTTKTATSSGSVAKPYVTIEETGTGWLRVRSEPTGFADNEVAKVDVGKKYSFIETNDTGWYKIEYETGSEGWISAKYATLTE